MIVSDLTYIRVDRIWHHICILADLYNREIIGYSAVHRAFASLLYNLNRLILFHTVRGSEFKSQLIYEALDAFDIQRSLSEKGSPYDNAVVEVMFNND